jgi:NTP pyrophosphatase (non-canonical NTP hydrolase)
VIDKDLALAATKLWGEKAQTEMAIEEAAEFIVAHNHYKRRRITKKEYVGEMVDAYIMLSQLRAMHGHLFEEVLDEKLKNLYKRINSASKKEIKK